MNHCQIIFPFTLCVRVFHSHAHRKPKVIQVTKSTGEWHPKIMYYVTNSVCLHSSCSERITMFHEISFDKGYLITLAAKWYLVNYLEIQISHQSVRNHDLILCSIHKQVLDFRLLFRAQWKGYDTKKFELCCLSPAVLHLTVHCYWTFLFCSLKYFKMIRCQNMPTWPLWCFVDAWMNNGSKC